MAGPWTANIHCDGRLDACVPASATSVLDVGCGDGFLAARLARRVPLVVAIDADGPALDRGPARFPAARVTWCHGDVLPHPLGGSHLTPLYPTRRRTICRMPGQLCAA